MRILITTGLSARDVGGPAQYEASLKTAFESLGHEVKVAGYGKIERLLPIGFRHVYFLLKIIKKGLWSDGILTLDTYSTGVPTVFFAALFGRKVIARVGGDYLWSAYVNRTRATMTLEEFYDNPPELTVKEQIISFFIKFFINNVDFLAFNTDWQRHLWEREYHLSEGKTGIVRNFIPNKSEPEIPAQKNFLWAGRIIPEKNIDMVKRVAEKVKKEYPEFRFDIVTGEPRKHVLERIKNCYAVLSAAFTDVCPNFIVEAGSFNKPFIMTNSTGLNEIYPKGGMFIDPKSETAWEASIKEMLTQNVYDNAIKELSMLKTNHSWQDIAKEFIDIWTKI